MNSKMIILSALFVVPSLFLILIGCANHEPVYYTIYTPEKHITNNSGHFYTEMVTNLPPVSSNSVSRVYAQATNESQQLISAQGPTNSLGLQAAQDEGLNDSDRKLIQQIRLKIAQDSLLGPIAPNLRFVAVNGKVTVNGQVRTQQQKDYLNTFVKQTAGVTGMNNVVTVKPDS